MDYEKEYNRVCNEYIPRVQELEEENKMLKGEIEIIKKELEGAKNSGEEFAYKRANAKEENKKLKEENEKLKDQFMMKLAMYYNLQPTSNQMVRLKEWNYGKRYDEVKYNMGKEIMDKLRPEFKLLEEQKDMLYRTNRKLTWLAILIVIMLGIISAAYILK